MIKVRIARATNNIEKIILFYRHGLGLSILSQFENHAGFSGIMLGHPNSPYHFEFTREEQISVPRAPTKENLIIFYYPLKPDWNAAIDQMLGHGFNAVSSHNPYWDIHGKTFEDFEGYRVVLTNEDWNPKISLE